MTRSDPALQRATWIGLLAVLCWSCTVGLMRAVAEPLGAVGGAAVAATGAAGRTAHRLKDAFGKAVNRQDNRKSSEPPVIIEGDPVERLKKLKQMLEAGLITQGDFDTKKADILSNL